MSYVDDRVKEHEDDESSETECRLHVVTPHACHSFSSLDVVNVQLLENKVSR